MSTSLAVQIYNFSSNKNNKTSFIQTEAFLIRWKKDDFIITSHNFLPIKNNIYLNDEKLKICINSKWNEILILKSEKKLYSLPIFSKIKLKLPSIDSFAFIKNDKVKITEITFVNYAFLENYPETIYIKMKADNPSKYISGTPVIDNMNNLIGLVSFSDSDYVYCLPSYYIIKSFRRKNSFYIPDINEEIIRVNRHLVKDNQVYNPYLGINVPLFTYFVLESDRNTELTYIKGEVEETINNVEFIEWSNLGIITNSRHIHFYKKFYNLSSSSLHLLKKNNPELCGKLFEKLKGYSDLSKISFRIKDDGIIIKST